MPALKYATGALRRCTPKPLAERPEEVTVALRRGETEVTATFNRRDWLIACCGDYSRLIGCRSLNHLAKWIADRPEWRAIPALLLPLFLAGCPAVRLWPDVG
jgi:hypothetical protein